MAEHQTYTVKGSWPFPTDMLRYDDAQPATGAAAFDIARLSGDYASSKEDIREKVEIKLIRPKRGLPAIDRWLSFGWEVVNGDDDTQYAVMIRRPREPTPYEKLREAVKDLIDQVNFTPRHVYALEDDSETPLPPKLAEAINVLTDTYNDTTGA